MARSKIEWTARAEALEECADHLEMSWTDDAIERSQGDILAKKLRLQAERCRLKADEYPYITREISLQQALKVSLKSLK